MKAWVDKNTFEVKCLSELCEQQCPRFHTCQTLSKGAAANVRTAVLIDDIFSTEEK